MPASFYTIIVNSTMSVNDESVRSAIYYDQEFQPDTTADRYMTDSNETEGKRIRRVLTNYFDP